MTSDVRDNVRDPGVDVTALPLLALQGLALTPQMGYSSWNDCGSVVTEEHIKATAEYMISSGLAAKGFVRCPCTDPSATYTMRSSATAADAAPRSALPDAAPRSAIPRSADLRKRRRRLAAGA